MSIEWPTPKGDAHDYATYSYSLSRKPGPGSADDYSNQSISLSRKPGPGVAVAYAHRSVTMKPLVAAFNYVSMRVFQPKAATAWKVWNGSEYVAPQLKAWDGTQWVTQVKTWDGTQWLT